MKSSLQNSTFLLKVSILLVIVFLGYMAQSTKTSDFGLLSDIQQVNLLKTTTVSQFTDNNWFIHQAR